MMGCQTRKGDSSTNVIVFIVMILAALILTTWYISSVRPTRYIVGTVDDDINEINRHLTNACTVQVYEATYLTNSFNGFFFVNGSSFCMMTDVFGRCEQPPCAVEEVNITLGAEPTLLHIGKTGPGETITISVE